MLLRETVSYIFFLLALAKEYFRKANLGPKLHSEVSLHQLKKAEHGTVGLLFPFLSEVLFKRTILPILKIF